MDGKDREKELEQQIKELKEQLEAEKREKEELRKEANRVAEIEENANRIVAEHQKVIAAQRDKLMAVTGELKAYKKMARRAMR